ncbi:MAG: tetratricopeptide repeat protein [Candidatus Auribacterota bacterium]
MAPNIVTTLSNDFKSNIIINLSACLYCIGDYSEAISYLLLVYDLQPNNIEVLSRIADGYSKLNSYDNALEYLNKATLLDPNNLDILKNLGRTYKLKGDYKNSIECFEEAKTLQPNDAGIYLALATIYGDTISPYYNMQTATEYSKKAVEILPSLSNRLVYLSMLSRNGRFKDALTEIRQIEKQIEFEQNRHYEHLMIGLFYNRIKDYKRAILHFHEALPDFAHILKDNPEFQEIRLLEEFNDLEKQIDSILNK